MCQDLFPVFLFKNFLFEAILHPVHVLSVHLIKEVNWKKMRLGIRKDQRRGIEHR